jgi:hypothetical protein
MCFFGGFSSSGIASNGGHAPSVPRERPALQFMNVVATVGQESRQSRRRPLGASGRTDINITDDMRSGRDQRPRGRFNANRPFNQQPRSSQNNQTFDSNGPNIKIRGSAHQIFERYLALTREATASPRAPWRGLLVASATNRAIYRCSRCSIARSWFTLAPNIRGILVEGGYQCANTCIAVSSSRPRPPLPG